MPYFCRVLSGVDFLKVPRRDDEALPFRLQIFPQSRLASRRSHASRLIVLGKLATQKSIPSLEIKPPNHYGFSKISSIPVRKWSDKMPGRIPRNWAVGLVFGGWRAFDKSCPGSEPGKALSIPTLRAKKCHRGERERDKRRI